MLSNRQQKFTLSFVELDVSVYSCFRIQSVVSLSLLSMKVIFTSVACHGTRAVDFEEIIQFVFWGEGCLASSNLKVFL